MTGGRVIHFTSRRPAETFCGRSRHGADGRIVQLGHAYAAEFEAQAESEVTCTRCKRRLGLLPKLKPRSRWSDLEDEEEEIE